MKSSRMLIVLLYFIIFSSCYPGCESPYKRNKGEGEPNYKDYVKFSAEKDCNDSPSHQCGQIVSLINKSTKYKFRINYIETVITNGISVNHENDVVINPNETIDFKCNRICPPSAPTTTTNYKIENGFYIQ